MNKEQALDKVRKLLALKKSPNEHEAASAAQKAREFLDKHNLTMAEVSVQDKETIQVSSFNLGTKGASAWTLRLAAGVVSCYDCGCLQRGVSGTISFIGAATDVKVAQWMMEYLMNSVVSWRRKWVVSRKKEGTWNSTFFDRPRSEATSYSLGMADTLCDRLDEIGRLRRPIIMSTGRDLIVMKKAKVDEYIRKHSTRTRYIRGSVGDQNAYRKGLQDGRSVPLNEQIEQNA